MKTKLRYRLSTLPTLILGALLCGAVLTTSSQTAHAGVDGWDAGYIISDHVFTNKNTMNAGDIQAFLNSKVSHCDTWGTQPSEFGGGTRRQWAEARGFHPPFTCLKDYSQDGKSAAQIIYDAAQEFSINPQVLLVVLQKEQSLVTDTWPISIQYRSATGYGCPDHGVPCDTNYYGFINQVRWAARMYRAIMNNSPTWYTPYVLGNNYIQYNPEASCGGSNVYIRNRATQALYNYTPYQPNQASLDAGWGTIPSCGAYGNRNFYLYFTTWFGSTRGAPYVSLDNPRWMKLNSNLQKRNPWTKESVGNTIPAGTQLRFVDKILIEGVWYLRTEHDRNNNLDYGIPQASVSDIEFEPLQTPRYMELNSNAHKTNPRNLVSNMSYTFPAGTSAKFTSKMLVNGQWFYRTEYDEQRGNMSAFYAVRVQELAYKNLELPRYMRVKNDTRRIHPALGTEDTTVIPANSEIKITSKILVGNEWHYRTEEDTAANTNLAIPSSDVMEIPYSPYDTTPKWFQLKPGAKKVHPASGTVTHTNFDPGTRVKIVEKILINGQTFYRTEFDATGSFDRALPANDIEEIPFIPFETPRDMRVTQTLQKVNPKTGTATGSSVSAGTVLNFATKININGQWYYRTVADTGSNLDLAIPSSYLEEVE